MKLMPYKIVEKGGKPYVSVKFKGEEKIFAPEEISAMILTKVCQEKREERASERGKVNKGAEHVKFARNLKKNFEGRQAGPKWTESRTSSL
jgi:hypothetical protein